MKNIFILIFLFAIEFCNAQSAMKYLDINNVKAGIDNRGRMFNDPISGTSSYEFPKGSGNHSSFFTCVMLSAKDSVTQQKYVIAEAGWSARDLFNGPLNDTGYISVVDEAKWKRIWKINFDEIVAFTNNGIHTISNTPKDILEWPAKGNPYLTFNGDTIILSQNLAPFVDVNNDGIYNALQGDYPKINGQQMTWNVYNDVALPKTNSNSYTMNLQIEQSSFACDGEPFSNTTLYNFKVTNKSKKTYENFRFGIFDEAALGWYYDNYIGFNLPNRVAITYNGDNYDENRYGYDLTQKGLMLVRQASDKLGNYTPGSFIYFNNDGSPQGFPSNLNAIYNYMNATWQDGTHLKKDCWGFGNGSNTDFIFPDDPSDNAGSSEKKCNNSSGERRYIFSTNGHTLRPNESAIYTYAIINTPLGSNNSNFNTINNLAINVYNNFTMCENFQALLSTEKIKEQNRFIVFPNPSKDFFTIKTKNNEPFNIQLYSEIGNKVLAYNSITENNFIVNTSNLSKGMYYLQIQTKSENTVRKIVIN